MTWKSKDCFWGYLQRVIYKVNKKSNRQVERLLIVRWLGSCCCCRCCSAGRIDDCCCCYCWQCTHCDWRLPIANHCYQSYCYRNADSASFQHLMPAADWSTSMMWLLSLKIVNRSRLVQRPVGKCWTVCGILACDWDQLGMCWLSWLLVPLAA